MWIEPKKREISLTRIEAFCLNKTYSRFCFPYSSGIFEQNFETFCLKMKHKKHLLHMTQTLHLRK